MQSPTPQGAPGVDKHGTGYLMTGAYSLEYLLSHHPYLLNDPTHFTEQQNGETYIFCWSRPNHSDRKENYIWRVFLSGPDVRLQLQCCIEQRRLPYIAGSYIFTMDPVDSDRPQVLRVVQPLDPAIAPYYLSLVVYLGIYPTRDCSMANWNALGSEFIEGPESPSQYLSLVFESENTFPVNPTSVIASGSNSTTHDSYSQVGMPGTYYTNTPSSNATIPETYQHSPPVSQSVQLAETVLMSVPPELNTRRLIDTFVHWYTSKLPKSVREVCCSLCCGPNSVKLWEAKPTNLARHIMAHSGVKWFQCPDSNCSRGAPRFTTKDQGKKHLEKHHPGTEVAALIELDPDLVFNVQGSRRT